MADIPIDADPEQPSRDWWRTEIIDMAPGEIRYRGYPIEELIGQVSFPQMIWLMTRGALPTKDQATLLEAALVAAVDHGPQAPSIAIARMAATCGVGLNNAMASGLNVLGDVHGGAGEQAVALYQAIVARLRAEDIEATACDGDGKPTAALVEAARAEIAAFKQAGGKFLPGFGHRFHPIDPRAPRLLALVEQARQQGTVSGASAAAAQSVEQCLAEGRSKPVPMNIDGATAVIYAELGFPAALARGLFCLS
ncbi:MAG: citryl-CoA lyase, partial [Rhodospirillaceae bacterium]